MLEQFYPFVKKINNIYFNDSALENYFETLPKNFEKIRKIKYDKDLNLNDLDKILNSLKNIFELKFNINKEQKEIIKIIFYNPQDFIYKFILFVPLSQLSHLLLWCEQLRYPQTKINKNNPFIKRYEVIKMLIEKEIKILEKQ